jgi:hypothetical protein
VEVRAKTTFLHTSAYSDGSARFEWASNRSVELGEARF